MNVLGVDHAAVGVLLLRGCVAGAWSLTGVMTLAEPERWGAGEA